MSRYDFDDVTILFPAIDSSISRSSIWLPDVLPFLHKLVTLDINKIPPKPSFKSATLWLSNLLE